MLFFVIVLLSHIIYHSILLYYIVILFYRRSQERKAKLDKSKAILRPEAPPGPQLRPTTGNSTALSQAVRMQLGHEALTMW